jgi:Domain of unknown function (DUF4384)
MNLRLTLPLLIVLFLFVKPAIALQSTITEAEGKACMGDDKSRKQTEDAALQDAKKRAVEFASTYIKSETEVKNFALEKDLLSAYSNAEVKVIQELAKAWYKDPASGDCLSVKIKAEVTPDARVMERMTNSAPSAFDDPSAPLKVKAWTDKKEYKDGDKIKMYLRGNKPFYARVLYKDASGQMIQLLPNPFRQDNYFNGGSLYEIPAGNDKFELAISPPFGDESIIVYASSSQLGEIGVQAEGGVYAVTTQAPEIGLKTRGIRLQAKPAQAGVSSKTAASEFFEDKLVVKTGK